MVHQVIYCTTLPVLVVAASVAFEELLVVLSSGAAVVGLATANV